MITTRTYNYSELEPGICSSCGDESTEIVQDDTRCVDCIEEEIFYNETMKGL